MIVARQTAGKTRVCPHCKATILESAATCPQCNHRLKFEAVGSPRQLPALTPLKIEGTIRHPDRGQPWEYSVVLAVCNDQGQEISRQVVGVGALYPAETRTFRLSVEIFTPSVGAPIK